MIFLLYRFGSILKIFAKIISCIVCIIILYYLYKYLLNKYNELNTNSTQKIK